MLQLWVNLPARDKMSAPGYQAIVDADIPKVALPEGNGTVRVIAGRYGEVAGPARTFTPIDLWDVRLVAGGKAVFELPAGRTTAVVVMHGTLNLEGGVRVEAGELALLEREGSAFELASDDGASLMLLSGEPIDEPIVGAGPFVMNTAEEIHTARRDFASGRFGEIAAGRH